MKHHTILSLIICGMLSTVGIASAEVRMSQEQLSIKANAIPIQTLLEDLSRQGSIRVTVLEKASLKDVTISEQFEGLSIEEGLNRLFAHWNYGLTRNTETGHIQEIFLASQRTKSDERPSTPQASLTSRDQERRSDEFEDWETLAVSFEEEERSEGGEPEEFVEYLHNDKEQGYTGYLDNPEVLIPPDLPPDIREAMLHDLGASRGIQ